MAYLKALGILRLVAEDGKDGDPEARGYWHNEEFVLRSRLDEAGLVDFFLNHYRPTPIVAPWGARSGFFAESSERTARQALEAIERSTTERLAPYRETIAFVRGLMKRLGVTEKAEQDAKTRFLVQCRAEFPDHLLEWLDSCYVLTTESRKFPPLLGTGGNEGSGSYVSGFSQQVVQCILERKHGDALGTALFATLARVESDQTPGHFSGRAAGGPNATQGFEGDTTTNPWDYLLCLEGTCLWASAVVRRLGQVGSGVAAFPFTARVIGAGATSLVTGDGRKPKQAKREIAELWCPLWSHRLSHPEVQSLLGEGRASVGLRQAADGTDMARAVATLGVDRGIHEFARTSFLMRNGQSFLSIPLGRFRVAKVQQADLLREIDPWLASFRPACSADNVPARFTAALRAIDAATFDFCSYGGAAHLRSILVALGQAERAMARTPGKIGQSKTTVMPLAGLSGPWIPAASDDSAEFAIAAALAAVRDAENKVGPLRANIEPFDWTKPRPGWAEKDRAVVWNAADLSTNLAAVLVRRCMDAGRKGCTDLPLASPAWASLGAVARFIRGDLDDRRIENLLWGLMLVDPPGRPGAGPWADGAAPLPRAYALLKLLFLPRPLVVEGDGDRLRARLARPREEGGMRIRPEPAILALLRAGRLGEACAIAMRRLRASGLAPLPGVIRGRGLRDGDWTELDGTGRAGLDPRRLAAALLIPVSDSAVNHLFHLATRGEDAQPQETAAATAAEGD